MGTSLWVLGTMVFRAYVANFDRFHSVYGVLGGVVILQLWCYLTALSILVGGEVAAIISEEAFDHLDAPPSRVTAPHTPVPYSRALEDNYVPNTARVIKTVQGLMSR